MKQTLKDKLVQEALDFYKISSMLDSDDDDGVEEFDVDEFEDEGFEDEPMDVDGDFDDSDEFSDDFGDFDDSDEPEGDPEDEEMFADEEGEPTNPDKEGLIRTVRGAYLVYKRATAESNYEELWIYNMGNVKTQTHVRNAILAGTDIDPTTLRSPTNDQTAEVWSKGNVQYLHINGLPN